MPSTAPDSRPPACLEVVAGIVRNPAGRVLLSRRPVHKHQGGLWEYPGGKVENGETLAVALARELHEELGIEVSGCRPFMTVGHDYPEGRVRLHFREVIAWRGEPGSREGQRFDWFAPEELPALPFPEANRAVTRALGLPDRWLVLPPAHREWRRLFPRLAGAGIGGVYLRSASTEDCPAMVALAHRCGLRAMVRDDVSLADRTGADGVHFSSAAAAALPRRPDIGLVSMACHSRAQLVRARALGVDMVLLSPVHATATHPGVPPLGWGRFAELAAGQPFAVYALGGMAPADLGRAREAGARGVAGISAFWPGDAPPAQPRSSPGKSGPD